MWLYFVVEAVHGVVVGDLPALVFHAAPLAVYLQNEYDSWETMYESYYYGYLIFAGRNKNSSSSVIYSDYRYYEIMADKTEIPFRTEER